MFDKQLLQMYEGTLRSRGYDVNDVEDIECAAIDDKAYVRHNALVLLVYKSGTKAIPVLKEALKDSSKYYENRCMAATLLGMLGDKSGLDKMRKDMAEFSKDDKTLEKERKDGKINPEYEQDLKKKYSLRLRYALMAANVLAEFGDCSGYELAAREAIESESAMNRTEAACALAWMCKVDEEQRKTKGLFPEDVLLIVAEKETESRNLFFLHSYLLTVDVVENNDKLKKIIETIEKSPEFIERRRKIRERAKEYMLRIKERDIKEKEKKKEGDGEDPNESEDVKKEK